MFCCTISYWIDIWDDMPDLIVLFVYFGGGVEVGYAYSCGWNLVGGGICTPIFPDLSLTSSWSHASAYMAGLSLQESVALLLLFTFIHHFAFVGWEMLISLLYLSVRIALSSHLVSLDFGGLLLFSNRTTASRQAAVLRRLGRQPHEHGLPLLRPWVVTLFPRLWHHSLIRWLPAVKQIRSITLFVLCKKEPS